MDNFSVAYSSIKGLGIISNIDIPMGEIIGDWIGRDKINSVRYLFQEGMKEKWFEKGNLGRYCNHQSNPNTSYKFNGTTVLLISKGIIKNEEITVDYRWCNILSGFYVDVSKFIEF